MVFLLWVCRKLVRHEDVDSVEDSITSEESNLDDDTGLLSIDDTSNDLASYLATNHHGTKSRSKSKFLCTVTC